MDDLRYLRDRQSGLIAQFDRWDHHAPDPTAVMIGKVFNNGSLPTTTGNYFAVHPVTVGGTESEGSAGTFSVDTASTVFFLVIGSKAPIVGDVLIAHSIDGRWVAEWGKKPTTGIVLPGGCYGFCPSTPVNISITWSTVPPGSCRPWSPFGSSPLPDGSMTWQPVTSDYLHWVGDSTFTWDGSGFTNNMRYFWGCSGSGSLDLFVAGPSFSMFLATTTVGSDCAAIPGRNPVISCSPWMLQYNCTHFYGQNGSQCRITLTGVP
jgi:hypothetical protein